MTEGSPHLGEVVAQARKVLGGEAENWLHKRNRRLADLSPFELARTQPGAKVVMFELKRAADEPSA